MSKASEYAKKASEYPFCALACGVMFSVSQDGGLVIEDDDTRFVIARQDMPRLVKWLRETYED